MARVITEIDLREQSDEIVSALERGESFVVTRGGITVGELIPTAPRPFVRAAEAKAAFAGLPHIDFSRFRRDVDSVLDQDPDPRV
jgi:antitoxin (DNA-binding transcriptional repressor) of toxin-antitoxin stability system